MRPFLALAIASTLAFTQLGCIKQMMLDSQISATRDAAGGFDTIADYELARAAASAGLVQFEGLHRLAPDNKDGLFLLAKGWVGYGYAFPEDDYEAADLADNSGLAAYHKARAQAAYDRALFYGLELLNKRADGFDEAKKSLPGLTAWLEKNFDDPKDAETLFWVGNAWLARVNIAKDDPAQVAGVWVGVAMLEQSVKLDPTYMNWSGTGTLGAYHARSSMAELDEAKKDYETAIAKSGRKSLLLLVNYARYACVKGDRPLFEKTLQEVLEAGDVDPNNRLQNTIAKRRAQRYATKQWKLSECGWES